VMALTKKQDRNSVVRWISFGASSLIITIFFMWQTLQKTSEAPPANFAKLATQHDCAAPDMNATDLKKISAELINPDMRDSPIKTDVLPRILANLPPAIMDTLIRYKIKFSTLDVRSHSSIGPNGSAQDLQSDGGVPEAFVYGSSGQGKILFIAPDRDFSSTIRLTMEPSQQQVVRGLHAVTLPAAVWYVLEVLWMGTPSQVHKDDNRRSNRSVWIGIKSQFAALIRMSPEEESHYDQTLDGGGRYSSQFASRAMTLFIANAYCSVQTYNRVITANPDAAAYFHKTLLCALGRPRHMSDTTYQSHCKTTAPTDRISR
jgi:hypothetical protein